MAENMGIIAPKTGKVYYSGSYWNDFPTALAEINRRATGSTRLSWYDDFFKTHKRKFKKVLMLNCGNGWPEREMFDKGYIEETVGVDFADDLLDEARQNAGSRPFRYYKMDINSAKFPETGFDLVINHAAAHHIANLNRVFSRLVEVMAPDGMFLNYDYIGPHRNQYPIDQWQAAYSLNKTLAANCQQILNYPHLPTMLVTDPSEAVHSELIIETMRRYFDFDFFKPIGGALAYLLLTHNKAIQKAPEADVTKTVKAIMKADGEYTNDFPDKTMFAYWVARPKRGGLKDTFRLRDWQKQEDTRESAAKSNGGRYYELDLIQQLYLELDELRIAKEHKQNTITDLLQQIDELLKQRGSLIAWVARRALGLLRRIKRLIRTLHAQAFKTR